MGAFGTNLSSTWGLSVLAGGQLALPDFSPRVSQRSPGGGGLARLQHPLILLPVIYCAKRLL